MMQPDLFSGGLARATDSVTSQEAARRITGRTERRLLRWFQQGQDATADELCAVFPDIYPPTLKSALSRLANHKLIVDTDMTRPSNQGCAMTVYRIVP